VKVIMISEVALEAMFDKTTKVLAEALKRSEEDGSRDIFREVHYYLYNLRQDLEKA